MAEGHQPSAGSVEAADQQGGEHHRADKPSASSHIDKHNLDYSGGGDAELIKAKRSVNQEVHEVCARTVVAEGRQGQPEAG